MIDFSLSPQQQIVREVAHQIAQTVLRPGSLQWDQQHRIPDEVLLQLSMLRGGFTQGEVPEEVGGEGEGVGAVPDRRHRSQANRIAVLGAEELAWGDASVLLSLPGPGLGGPPVRSMGTPEQRRRFFSVFQQPGLHYGAYALTEPGAGSDVAGIQTRCRKQGRYYLLSGRKCYITNGARADWVVVFATVDPALGRAGHRAFVVERGTPGFSVGKIERKMGLRASETAELIFEEARVPEENLLGGEEYYRGKEGFVGAMQTFDSTRPMVAAVGLGIARAAWEAARDFVRDHYLLSRPLPRYAQLAAQLAQDRRLLDAARLLCWRAAWMADEGLPNSKEASMAKAYAARVALRICAHAVDILGAHGLQTSQLVEKWYRDIKVFDIFEGTGQIQRIVISRRILREPPSF
ncbi:MAG: acyl-CoA dehydrogenase family protein [Myxococcales bacterium]|nr:acyl-CoA dehydrogenase family protein [Myxococcota bacterium]MDW8281401.1 acyl-CoA dehydrogenase family protein [Myxococcales bacterium]